MNESKTGEQMENGEMIVPSGTGQGIYKEKGSRFIATATRVEDEHAIEGIIRALKKEHHSARHHCYAWVLGTDGSQWRANDDGEPSSSAGKPILNQIQKRGMTQTLVTVVRYFGGIKLGVSGLINAYRSAAGDALEDAGQKTVAVCDPFRIICGFDALSDLQRILGVAGIAPVEERYESNCQMLVMIPGKQQSNILSQLKKISNLEVQLHRPEGLQ